MPTTVETNAFSQLNATRHEIRGIRDKIDERVGKMGGAGEFHPKLGLTDNRELGTLELI
jgi:hypothetical protein